MSVPLEYTELLVLGLRLTFMALLYGMLLSLFLLIRRDMGLRAMTSGGAVGRLLVLDPVNELTAGLTEVPLEVVTTIGRARDNVLSLPDSYVSLHHAVLSWREGSWWLRDLGSTNGTWLNQIRVVGEAPVRFGDVILVGRVRLQLVR